ncbi:hypothetical protein BJ912DRAFT_479081 [Pholiota molesta]|nr:hypothetical protein BJ912DRAFT_479081 [Pholiota molesta]
MGFMKALRSGLASIFDRKNRANDGNGTEHLEADTSRATIGREIPFQRQTTQPGSEQQMADTSQATTGHEIPFDHESTQRGGEQQMADTSQATIGHEIPFDHERTQRGSQRQEADTSRQITNDADPNANAMFNGNVAIYGGRFAQTNVTNRDKDGFTLLRERVASSAFHNSAQRADPPRCHPDTRITILQSIYDWIVQQGPCNQWLLWLNGAAGAGKSAIMQTIAEHCFLTATVAIGSFFFARTDLTRNTMAPLVATLVYQFIQAIPETSDDIILTIENNPLIFEQSLEFQIHYLLIQPLLRMPAHLRRLFVVFIDGLDECNDRAHQSSLIRVLGNISSGRNIPVIFIIASRREPQIEAEFCQDQVADNLTTIPLDDIPSNDIRRYLYAKFEEIKATHLRRRFLPPDWPSSEIIDEIVEKSSGQFIYASVVIGYISLPHAHPAIQLEIIDGVRPHNPSENPFAHLDALYQHIFSQVKRLDAVRNILALHLIDPEFNIPALESLFQLAPGELEVLFADLTALVRCSADTPDDGIKFLHASLPDFLLDKRRSGAYYMNFDEYRTNLLSLLLERPCPIPDPHSSTSLEWGERLRWLAIYVLLGQAKASNRLQRAFMNFNSIIYTPNMARLCLHPISCILNVLKKLDLRDWGQAYRHVMRVFAAEFAEYWYIDNIKDEIRQNSPDLAACVKQLIRQKKS